MRLKSAIRLLALIAASSAVPYAASSCSSPTPTPDAPDAGLADVIIEGSATRPALAHLNGVYPLPWEDWGGLFSAPAADMQQLSAATPFTFTFATNVSGTSGCDAGSSGGAAGATASAVSPRTRAFTELEQLFGAERKAHAQSASFSGEGHFLVFATAGNNTVLRVFTSNLSYTPDDAAWQKLVATSGGLVSLTITSAQFQGDALTGCGPFLGQTITFTVQ